ncbi:unnamed protein product [Cochlearia groenlandica]
MWHSKILTPPSSLSLNSFSAPISTVTKTTNTPPFHNNNNEERQNDVETPKRQRFTLKPKRCRLIAQQR